MKPVCDIIGPDPHCSRCGVPASVLDLRRHCPAKPLGPCGVGCHLARLLSWFARKDSDCGCQAYADQLDADGPDAAEADIDGIVAHLLEQAEKRSVILGLAPAAVVIPLVRAAIVAARREAAQTWPSLDEGDITGADEADADQPIRLGTEATNGKEAAVRQGSDWEGPLDDPSMSSTKGPLGRL
jgi:hypothetical protein